MENISLKLEPEFLKEIEKIMKNNRYMTKTEFIRECIRDKITELEKRESLIKLRKLYGTSKKRTSDKELHKAREKAFEELERELN